MSRKSNSRSRYSVIAQATSSLCESLERRTLFAPLSSLPLLSSLPGAPITVHLDFDGTPAFEFDASDGTWASGPMPGNGDPILAFSIDGNVNDYTTNEINAINQIWQHVSEKFSPFRINVTTIAPGSYDDGQEIHAIMGGSTNDWALGGGGIAPLNAFTNGRPNSAFTFTVDAVNLFNAGTWTWDTARHFMGETAAHEVGHTLGLEHQSVVNGSVVTVEYSNGNATTAPIMGGSSLNPGKRGLWYQGPTSSRDGNNNLVAMGFQDDLAMITRPGNVVQYRSDDYGSFTSAGPIFVDPASGGAVGGGTIETHGDIDAHLFTAIGPLVQFTVTGATYGGMLAPALEIWPFSGGAATPTLINNFQFNTSSSIAATGLTPGQSYVLRVQRQGSEYGSMGQYLINGSTGAFAGLSGGTITVNGYSTANDLDITYISSTDMILLQNNVFGGAAVQQFPRSQVSRVNVRFTQGGADTIDIFGQYSALNIPVDIQAGSGTDTLYLEGTTGNDTMWLHTNSSAQNNNTPITFTGIDQIRALGFDGDDTFNVTQNNVPVTLMGNAHSDTFNVGTGPSDFLMITAPVAIFGDTGSDRLNVGTGFAQAVSANISFDGGSDGFDTIYFYDTNNTATAEYDVNGGIITYHGFAPPYTVSYASVDQIEFNAGSGNDFFTVRSNVVVPIVRAYGNGGNDSFTAGDGAIPTGVRTFDGGAGTGDSITIDIHNDTVNRTYNVSPSSTNPPGVTVNNPNVEKVVLLGGIGNDIITATAGTYSQELTIDAGGGTDIVNVVGAEISKLTVRGGTDSALDFLDIIDHSFPGNVVGGTVYADRIDRDVPGQTAQVFYSGFSAVDWYQQAQQNAIIVEGVSPDIGTNYQFAIIGNTLDDYLQVRTQDAQGNPTILGNLWFNGGGGPDVIQAFAGPSSANYRLYDPFGGNTAFLANNGPGWVAIASDVEAVQVFGGPANDTFAVEQYKQGGALSLFGGDGNDNCTIGNGNMQANLTNASAFTFDGGANSDRFTIANGLTNSQWGYAVNTNTVIASISGVYSWTSTVLGIESQYVFAGSSADAFFASFVAPGLYTEFNGFGGYDGVSLGFSIINLDLEQIRGPIVFNAGADGGAATLDDSIDTSGDIAHLTANTLGAFGGDTLFGPGGSFTFSGLTSPGGTDGLTLYLGSAADTVYARPLASSRVTIHGNNPAAAPGDSLNLATAGLSAPSVNGTPASGNLTSASTLQLSWSGFEGSIATDAIAPAVVAANINLNGIPGPGRAQVARQAIDVQFTENVSGLISAASLQLTNLTTGQAIPTANIAVQYNLATNVASFTFPGYPNGVLPDGDYSGKILAGLPDFFGNSLPADAPFSFFFLNGDANHDRKVDVADLGILASNWQQSGRTFSQGDFDYNGSVDVNDLGILASKWQQNLAGAAPTDSAAPDTRASINRSTLRDSIFSNPKLKNRPGLITAFDELN